MTTRCLICTDPRIDAIEAALCSGTVKEVAAQFDVSRSSLSRHRARHVSFLPDAPGTTLQDQIDYWREAAVGLLHQSTIDSDSRGVAQAVTSGLRAVELQSRQQEQIATETVAKASGDDRIDIRAIDRHVQKVIAAMATLQADSNLLRIAAALVDDPALFVQAKVLAEGENHESVSQNRTN